MTWEKLKTNNHGHSFKAHLKVRHQQLYLQKKSDLEALPKFANLIPPLEARKLPARGARKIGEKFAFTYGGSYDIVADANARVRELMYLEANHSPPNDSYTGTKYEAISYGARPAHAMLFYHHRAPRGVGVGGLTSTGGSGLNKEWAAKLHPLMKAGMFADAMAMDFRDVLNTTAPNRGYYAPVLHRTATYAWNIGLIDDEAGMYKILAVISEYIKGEAYNEAFADAEEAR